MLVAMRFVFVFVWVAIFPFFVFAQEADDAAKEKLRQETAFLEQLLTNGKNLRLPENRAFVYAKVASTLWQVDEKRARQLFQDSIADLIAAQTDAEAEKGNKTTNNQFLNNLIYGQLPRWDILYSIGNCDAEFALDAMTKTRPRRIVQALANLNGDRQSSSYQYARNELQSEQRLIAMAAEQNPQNAVKLLRESLKKEITYDTFNLLKKIQQKDPETANQLAEEVGRKLLETKLDEDNQDSSFIQYFLAEFARENPPAGQVVQEPQPQSLKISDSLLRDLAEKIVKFTLRPNATSFYENSQAMRVIEKFFPAGAEQIKQRQAKIQNQYQNAQSQAYSKLMQSDAPPSELLSQAEKFPSGYRNEIYRRAAEKTAESGNVIEAQKIITANLSEEEGERYLSQMNYNLATQAVSKGKFDEASALINQISEENTRLNALTYLATSIYQKDSKNNQKWASTVLDQARALIPDPPEKGSEMNSLMNVASVYANIEPEQAFRLIESLIAPLNEYSEASAVLAKYNDYGNFRQGEFQLGGGNNILNVYNLPSVLKVLRTKDFARTIELTNRFTRPDVRANLQLQLLGYSLPINARSGFFMSGAIDTVVRVKERSGPIVISRVKE